MFIKTLTIQGFKSYREQTQVESFSPRHNVVVGRNGSGKSNFFAAIRFVLSDAYTAMSREERQSLLHEGVSSTTTLSAFVEIVFDNSDNRFPTGNGEVVLRRTIGLKKDEYTLDKKSASKADVMNLLESAGFSKSNPYYIVPQGRITALTNAKDHERLALLKEVAGTKVYEQRRTESLRIMAETDAKRTKINELIDYIESRLSELEEEKEELKEFQEKDKERRCLEYAMYQRELQDVAQTLDEIEEERKEEVHNANKRREMFTNRERSIQELEKEIANRKHASETLAMSRSDVQAELTELIRNRTEIQCVIDDFHRSTSGSGSRRETLQAHLEELNDTIRQKETILSKLVDTWSREIEKESNARRRLDLARGKLASLFAKQGRVSKFRTKNERDAYIQKEIQGLESYYVSQQSGLDALKGELSRTEHGLLEVDDKVKELRGSLEAGRARTTELADEINQLKDNRAALIEQRKDLWREDTKLESLSNRAADELKSAERSLASMMDKDTGMGLRAIDNIAEQHKLRGLYGPLYRLLEITDPKYNIPVELTAGNSLFHVVVDNDETAAKVLDIMMKERTGRVTFMPLNRLKPKAVAMPAAQDAVPLLDKLRFEDKFQPAFQQVFGKTCVCRDLTIAASYVKSHGINTITIDGDKVDRKGALTGGFHDVRRSRIEAIKNVKTWRNRFEGEGKKLKETKAKIVELDQLITSVTGQIQLAEGQQTQIRITRERTVQEGTTLTKEKERLAAHMRKLQAEIEEMQTDLTSVETKLQGYRDELTSPMMTALTEDEQKMIDNLGGEVEILQNELFEISKDRNKLEGTKNVLEIELNESLRRRRDEIDAELSSLSEAGSIELSSADVETRKRELRTVSKSIQLLTEKTQALEKESDDLANRIADLQKQSEALHTQQGEDSRSVYKQQKTAERYLAKRAMLQNRKEECNRSIRDLGVLPEEAFEKYTKEKLDRLMKKLHTVNEGLKKFAHVNKKAFEQYNNFTKQRDQLLERRDDLDTSAKSIEDLVEILDQRKDEAIERTFKQVASNFEEVFERLVPAGRGRLIIQRRIDQDGNMDQDDDDVKQSAVDNYTGVSIKVSFNSKVDEGLRIQQLSGGQKSLVALATVFAIQKCDPAPFYLFDEIDANLDAQYRTAVAAMIQSLSETGQFIVTTFRPEMLVTADKFYGVLFNNQKVSSIRPIKREEAMEFVDQEAQAH